VIVLAAMSKRLECRYRLKNQVMKVATSCNGLRSFHCVDLAEEGYLTYHRRSIVQFSYLHQQRGIDSLLDGATNPK
jgi:hypothetical protein